MSCPARWSAGHLPAASTLLVLQRIPAEEGEQ